MRRLTAIFDTQNRATIKLAGGEVKELDTIHMRITEYTVGDDLAAVMPAPLPENVAFTYAVELSIDEALKAGAKQVNFKEPIPVYVDNFLHFPAGTIVPVGYYDRNKTKWVPAKDGLVIDIVAERSDVARIDVDGDGRADNGSYQLERLGVSELELRKLAAQYDPDASLWRVPIHHFSPHDFNWGFAGPSIAPNPVVDNIENLDNPCTQPGSIIECENQVLGEIIPIRGTPFGLAYRSEQIVYPAVAPARLGADYNGMLSANLFEDSSVRVSTLPFKAKGSAPRGMASSAGGTVFMAVAVPGHSGVQVMRFSEAGVWEHVAGRVVDGNGDDFKNCINKGACSDGSPPKQTLLGSLSQRAPMAAGPDGAILFYSRGNACVRRIDLKNQSVSTIYGICGDVEFDWRNPPDPLSDEFAPLRVIDLGADLGGGVYVSLVMGIVHVDADGRPTMVVGGGDKTPADGLKATEISATNSIIAVDRSGKLYFTAYGTSGNQAIFTLDENQRLIKLFETRLGANQFLGLEAGAPGVLYLRKNFGVFIKPSVN